MHYAATEITGEVRARYVGLLKSGGSVPKVRVRVRVRVGVRVRHDSALRAPRRARLEG